MPRRNKQKTWSMGLAMVALALFVGAIPLRAESTAAIAQGFQTTEKNVPVGTLMSLTTANKNSAELSTADNVQRLVGVVGEKPLVELAESDKKLQVVTSGITGALVSDINGQVKAGDKITASPIAGVGMKATRSSQVVGTAQTDLDTSQAKTRSIADHEGNNQTVRIGIVPVQVNVTYYAAPEDQTSFLPAFIQNFANAVAGREIAGVRVVISGLALLLAFVAVAALLYSSVRSSIISIGRNPLSEIAVRKGLLQVGATVIGILLVTLITVYLILVT